MTSYHCIEKLSNNTNICMLDNLLTLLNTEKQYTISVVHKFSMNIIPREWS
jgi:hypothetical protein